MIHDQRRRAIETDDENSYYSTFNIYQFNNIISSRVRQLFGWSTDISKTTSLGYFEMSIHIIFFNYLLRHGVAQHFYSHHGPEYDDKYSYLHGMNLLSFEGYSRAFTIHTIKRIINIIKHAESIYTTQKKYKTRERLLEAKRVIVPVDKPRVGILTPSRNLNDEWVIRLRALREDVQISDDIRDLVANLSPDDFVDYSLSRSYKYILEDYVDILDLILQEI